MKTLLIRPPIYSKNLRYPSGPRFGLPLSILTIAAALEREGLPVAVYDSLIDCDIGNLGRNGDGTVHVGASWERIAKNILDEKPAIVGITNPFLDFSGHAIQTARTARSVAPGAAVIIGGPHASSAPESFFGRDTGIDFVFRGDGERSLVAFVKTVAAGGDPRGIDGISFEHEKGVRSNPLWPVGNLDDLPFPAYHLVDMERYFSIVKNGYPSRFGFAYPGSEREVSLLTSRGCPYRCIFCGNHLHMGRRFRSQSADYVLGHMELLIVRYGVRHFHLEDDNVALHKERFEKILVGIKERRWPITWDTPNGIRAEGLSEDLLRLAKDTGCTYLVIGIESGNQRVLDSIVKKNLDLAAVETTARLCRKVGIDLHAFYVVGFPGESRREIKDTFRFAHRMLGRYDVVPHLCSARPLPGTELQAICEEKGFLTEPRIPDMGSGVHGELFARKMIRTAEFSPDSLEQWVGQFNRMISAKLILKLVRWLLVHPLVAKRLFALFMSEVRHGPMDAAKRLLFGGLLYKNNFLRKNGSCL
ncbi:MAG: radical SAM protein [Chitinispirillaceae bacterium]|nr:radical SAM protein [Chitinispirillaceae bacterium]